MLIRYNETITILDVIPLDVIPETLLDVIRALMKYSNRPLKGLTDIST